MFWIFAGLSVGLLLEAIVTLKGVQQFRNFFLREFSSTPIATSNWPKVALLAPLKGMEAGLHENIRSWIAQDYPDFKIFFVIESPDDAAAPLIRSFQTGELLIAGKSQTCGQKVHNLRYAIDKVAREFEVFAFVDSDCWLKPDWLRNLIHIVKSDPQNAATGYRWFTSEKNFGSRLRAAWNSSVLTLYKEKGENNFAWGGSTAIRRETFETSRVPEFWNGSISDDYSLTNALKASGRRVNFVPGALAFTHDSIGLFQFMKWAFRQLFITRIYHPQLWTAAFLFHCIWFLWILTGLSFPGYFVLAFLAVQLIQALKADLRWQCVNRTGLTSPAQRVSFWLLGPIVGLCNFLLILSTIFRRTIRWRDVEYSLFGPDRVEVRHR